MKKSIKILTSFSISFAAILPIAAISCENKKTALQNQINLAKQALLKIEYDDFKKELKTEIDKAEIIFNKQDATKKEYTEATEMLKKKTEEIINKNSEKNSQHINNKKNVDKKINELKQYAHEKLSDAKDNALKSELVSKYQEKEEEHSKKAISEYTKENTEKFIAELDQILNEIKEKKEQNNAA
ncbi:Hypothetical protein, predicted lipoprotein [Metamycoplasma alkalescens 14918]|uniref:Lipoprotein n=1 Tax=Metamycoplasma alkalescens 14918 TaxID=1188234 RepID=N9SQF9_9BACT|nr:hypothetical protein [Metamycoplasma alkalescens]ENY53700.1 Hypothetical protein, predicted lipoprotein [Metamycoplasma alkalescens 14918]